MCLTSSSFQSLTHIESMIAVVSNKHTYINQFFCYAKKANKYKHMYTFNFKMIETPISFFFLSLFRSLGIKSNGKMEIALWCSCWFLLHILSTAAAVILYAILWFISHRTILDVRLSREKRERKRCDAYRSHWKVRWMENWLLRHPFFLCREAIW